MNVTDLLNSENIVWHQKYEIEPGIYTPGASDIGWLLQITGLPQDLSGKSVLDIGTTNGFGAFEAERRGADHVIATDILPPSHFGFDRLSEYFNSNVEFIRSSVYELDNLFNVKFDYVLFLGVIYHLRHPLLALDNVQRVTKGTAYIESAVENHQLTDLADTPVSMFFRRDGMNNDSSNWFVPTTKLLDEWCISSGLITKSTYSWPEDSPTRCCLTCEPCDGQPEYTEVSYERPIKCRVDGFVSKW